MNCFTEDNMFTLLHPYHHDLLKLLTL